MLGRRAMLFRSRYLLGITLLCYSCHKVPKHSLVKVSFEKTMVRMGEMVHVIVEGAPAVWTGEMVVNDKRHFQIDPKLTAVRVTFDNGFHGVQENTVTISLKDGKGEPLTKELEFQLTVTMPQFEVGQEVDQVGEAGNQGWVSVRAPNNASWVVGGVPDWITILDKPAAGSGILRYRVQANTSNDARSAAIVIGDVTYFINQDPATKVHIPFAENFTGVPTPVWELRPDGYSATRWVIEDFEKLRSVPEISPEGVEGGNSLVVNRKSEANQAWQSQIYMTRLDTAAGSRYRADYWVKAENAGPLWMVLAQRVEPYQPCAAIKREQVTPVWTKFSYEFSGGGERCGVDENRLSLYLGSLVGKVWISRFSIVRE